MNGCWTLPNASSIPINLILNNSRILGLNPTWSWCVILLMCWIQFANIFFRIFAPPVIRDIGLQFLQCPYMALVSGKFLPCEFGSVPSSSNVGRVSIVSALRRCAFVKLRFCFSDISTKAKYHSRWNAEADTWSRCLVLG